METVLKMLKKRAKYLHKLRSDSCVIYEFYGRARMALELGAITLEQFRELNTLVVFGKQKGGVSRETRN